MLNPKKQEGASGLPKGEPIQLCRRIASLASILAVGVSLTTMRAAIAGAGGKTWTVGIPIQGGRMTAPQDQSVSPTNPTTVTVCIGGSLLCSLEPRTDSDHWTQGANSGDDPDELTYAWTGPGQFDWPGGPFTGWTAPDTPGKVTLQCTINDLPTAVVSPDTGTRNDSGTLVRKVDVYVVNVTLKSLRFSSDHGILRNNNGDWTDTGDAYAEPEWDATHSYPISQSKGTTISAVVALDIFPTDLPVVEFNLTGDGPENYLDFSTTGNIGGGLGTEINVTASACLGATVTTVSNQNIAWSIILGGCTRSLGNSTGHKVYVTFGSPTGSVCTEKRLAWDCQQANNSGNPEAVADSIHNAIGQPVDPPFERGDKQTEAAGWILMAGGTFGECDGQAALMRACGRLLGIAASEVRVYATTNAGEDNCLDYETRACPVHQEEFLLLDFYGGGTPQNMNQFEGCCQAAGHFYSVYPKHKATNDYTLLQALGGTGATQRYCHFNPDTQWWIPCDQAGSSPAIP